MSYQLASALREGTKRSHTLAENTAFMKCFLKGILEREPLRQLIANLYFVYSTLEEDIRSRQQDPIVGPLYFPILERTAQLEKDLAFHYGENWRNQVRTSPEGSRYVGRICEVANHDPALLVAHAYVRYMGDLSGGQALKNIIRSALDLPAGEGTAFYEFEGIPTVEVRRAIKGRYRDALNALPIDAAMAQKIIDEANLAFELNRNVMHELEPLVKEAVGEHVFDLITRQDKPGSTDRRQGATSIELIAAEEV
ncbi:Heme oxygenase superfamily [Synechococcus sp. PCC 7335]|uniref:biliverdin-producing heme oxygenase n=1 Tax=Synechococcus sp. (strain ATCC 29403 / PCC 7335) TaxID=91464 RepID=UPI00017EB8FF|nr:heme oxygenase (biliverdin-producing) [Synechococcus sp. PCC 7335]EDX83144.1 Heme oxygenase superfamily [Synechococcus sp. PCC 7335]